MKKKRYYDTAEVYMEKVEHFAQLSCQIPSPDGINVYSNILSHCPKAVLFVCNVFFPDYI